VSVCPECKGEGKIYSKKCSKCGGDGRTKSEQAVEVNIPAGIDDGQTLSVHGAGEAGEKGSPAGDLFVNVRVVPDKRFKRQGQDIFSSETISFSLAALGGEMPIETIDGRLILKIPSGTQSGETFRVKGKGVPELGGRGRGNHLVKIIVRVPKKLSREQKKKIEELKEFGE
jgi:molecular chaperone DnaJ